MPAKERKYNTAAFIDLEKAFDRIDWDALGDLLGVYEAGGSECM